MAARVFHFMRKASDAHALCGAEVNTKRDSNWSSEVDGVSCKRCIKKIESIGLAAFTKKDQKVRTAGPHHFIESAAPKKTRALCGKKIRTETDTNYTVQRDGVTCADCLEEMKPKRKKDKPALRRLEKLRRHASKYLGHVSDAGRGSHGALNDEQSMRNKLAEDLCDVIDAMHTREKEGWLSTVDSE
jgi:hypothetical protein